MINKPTVINFRRNYPIKVSLGCFSPDKCLFLVIDLSFFLSDVGKTQTVLRWLDPELQKQSSRMQFWRHMNIHVHTLIMSFTSKAQ